jgi:hypothetical protein
MSKTAGVQFGIFLNNLKAFALEIGEAVLPGLVKLTKPLQDLAKWFGSLDAAQKKSIGKWATYITGILLVGGTIVSVGGMILSFVAILGKFGIAGSGVAATVLIIVGAIKVLTGEWTSLSDAITAGTDTMLGSWQGFIAMSSLVVIAALRMRKAFMGIMAMQASMGVAAAGGAGAGGTAGLLGGIMGAFTTGRLTAMYKAEQGAGRLRAALSGAGTMAMALPGPLKIAAAAVGLGAGAALAWKFHMRGVRGEAEKVAAFNKQTETFAKAPARQAALVGRIGLDVREVVRQRNALQELNAQIKTTRGEISKANAAERPRLQRELTDLIIQRADQTDSLRQAQNNLTGSFDSMHGFVRNQINLLQDLGRSSIHITEMENKYKRLGAALATAPKARRITITGQMMDLSKQIDLYKGRFDTLSIAANSNAIKIKNAYAKTARDLQSIDLLPKMKPGALEAMLRVSLRRGRALTIPEMKTIIKAVADPSSLRKLPRDIQTAVRSAKIQVKIEAQKTQARKDLPAFAKGLGKVLPAIQIQTKQVLAKPVKKSLRLALYSRRPLISLSI